MSRGWVRALLVPLRVFLCLALAAGGLGLTWSSFGRVREFRQIERLPRTVVGAVVPGEVNVAGEATSAGQVLTSAHFHRRCLYYRYVREVRVEDSDGGGRWDTVEVREDRVPFGLSDRTGTIRVLVPERGFRPSLPVTERVRVGDYRHTEWRIAEGDHLIAIGVAFPRPDGMDLRLDAAGDLEPLLSMYSELEERGDRALVALVLCACGLAMLSVALYVLAWLLGMHRLLPWLTILTVTATVVLAWFGVRQLQLDLEGGLRRVQRQKLATSEHIRGELARYDIAWAGLDRPVSFDELGFERVPPERREMLRRMRLDLARAQRRYMRQRSAFPERVLAPMLGIARVLTIPLPPEDRALLERHEADFEPTRIRGGGFVLLILALVGGTAVLTWLGFRKVKTKRCIENLPTAPARGVVFGLAEVAGVVDLVDGDAPTPGPLTGRPCVHYRYQVQERRGSGKNAHWYTLEDRREDKRFLVRDDSGALPVVPAGAEVMTRHRDMERKGARRYIESRLELGDALYALGPAAIDPETGASLELREGEEREPFLLSNLGEREVMLRIARWGMLWLDLAFVLLLTAALLGFGLMGAFQPTDWILAALVGPLYMGLATVVLHYNDLVFLRERIDRAWANIEVSLKKRRDLIPGLEQVARRYLAHERELQEALTDMRSRYAGGALLGVDEVSGFLAAEGRLATRLLGLAEANPELRGSEVVQKVADGLVDVENEVALMRQGYNDAVLTYDNRVQSFPDLLLARLFGFAPRRHLVQGPEVRRRPRISMAEADD